MLESSDGSTCDVTLSDVMNREAQDGYSDFADSKRRIFAFGKCVTTGNKGEE